MTAASTAPKTTTSTMRATGTPKISVFSMSLLASVLPIRLRLASPVWARQAVAGAGATRSMQRFAAFFSALSVSPASTTAISVERLSWDTIVGSPVW